MPLVHGRKQVRFVLSHLWLPSPIFPGLSLRLLLLFLDLFRITIAPCMAVSEPHVCYCFPARQLAPWVPGLCCFFICAETPSVFFICKGSKEMFVDELLSWLLKLPLNPGESSLAWLRLSQLWYHDLSFWTINLSLFLLNFIEKLFRINHIHLKCMIQWVLLIIYIHKSTITKKTKNISSPSCPFAFHLPLLPSSMQPLIGNFVFSKNGIT